MNENAIAKARYEALEDAKRATRRSELFEAQEGLRSLLAGGWGTENLDALGGGKTKIEKAFAVLTRECEAAVRQAYPAVNVGGGQRARFFSDQCRRYYVALKRIAEFEGDADGAAPIAREALSRAEERNADVDRDYPFESKPFSAEGEQPRSVG